MIVKTFTVLLIVSVTLIYNVTCSSYSNVYVESEVVPRGYYSYGTPYPSIANPRLSQINSLPSVPGYVGPCVSPCVYPVQTVAAVAPINPSPNIITYNAPSVPVAVAPTNQEATGYEYSYVVYDQNTGDHKAQRELSDGSVVRGEYSFLQPDGYVREVQYVADDISGFNAVVRNFLPIPVEDKIKVEEHEHKESSPPCHETKNESLKDASEEDSEEVTIKHLIKLHEKLHKKNSNEESAEKSIEHHHDKSKESEGEENTKEQHHKDTKKVSKEESGEESEVEPNEKPSKKHKHSKEQSGEESEEKLDEKQHIKHKHSKEEFVNGSEENSKEEQHKKSKKESKESEEELESEESKEEIKEKSRKKSSKETEDSRENNKNKSKKGSKEASNEDFAEKSEELSHGKHKEASELLDPSSESLISYRDILRCIEAAMKKIYGVPAAMQKGPSPLTYIILNKPC